jgi:TolB protein
LIVFKYSRADGTEQGIYTIRPDGKDLRRLTNVNTNVEPTWSPDGRQIAFVSERNLKSGIWVMNADGTSIQRLLPKADQVGPSPHWRPR